MAFEKAWSTVSPIPLTADGTSLGVITVADTDGFKVKGIAQLKNNTGLNMIVQVNQVLSKTTIIVGKPGSSPSATEGGIQSGSIVDVSAFTTALLSTIGFGMQPKNKIKPDDIEQATYEADPTVAVRTIGVDPYGDFYTADNPLPVAIDGTISIAQVEVKGTNGNFLEPNADGSINTVGTSVVSGTVDVNLNGLNAFQTSQYPVGTGSVQITPTPLTNRSSVCLKAICPGTNIIYIGNSSGVTTSTGYPLFNGDTVQMDLTPLDQIWAVGNANGNTLCALEIG